MWQKVVIVVHCCRIGAVMLDIFCFGDDDKDVSNLKSAALHRSMELVYI